MGAAAWISRRRALYSQVLRAAHRGNDLRGLLKEEDGRDGQEHEEPARTKRVPCRDCRGRRTDAGCTLCGGSGWSQRALSGDERRGERMPREVAPIVSVWAAIDRHGPDGAELLAPEPGLRLSEWVIDAVFVLDGEVSRLEFERDVDEALEEARARRARER